MSGDVRGGFFDGLAIETSRQVEAVILVTKDGPDTLGAAIHLRSGSDVTAEEVQTLVAFMEVPRREVCDACGEPDPDGPVGSDGKPWCSACYSEGYIEGGGES